MPLMFVLALLSEHWTRWYLLLTAQVKLKGRVAWPHLRGEVSPDLPALWAADTGPRWAGHKRGVGSQG